jgi:hypothetical protein
MTFLDRLFQRDFLAALRACGPHFASAALFSFGINVLYLAMPIYMLQVYDRVLSSSSVPTLVMLTIALLIALATLAALDYVRSIVLTRSGVRLDNQLAARVLGALVERANQARGTERGQTLTRSRHLSPIHRGRRRQRIVRCALGADFYHRVIPRASTARRIRAFLRAITTGPRDREPILDERSAGCGN